jgi:hypothetical protein
MLKKTAFVILSILSIVATSFAQTRTYLVYTEHFPQDRYRTSADGATLATYSRFDAIGAVNVKDAGGQPFRMTSYRKSSNPKYAIYTISPNRTRLRHLNSMEEKGYIKLLETMDVVSEYHPERGGCLLKSRKEFYGTLPYDFYVLTSTSPI